MQKMLIARLYFEVPDETAAYDAANEILRPQLKEFQESADASALVDYALEE